MVATNLALYAFDRSYAHNCHHCNLKYIYPVEGATVAETCSTQWQRLALPEERGTVFAEAAALPLRALLNSFSETKS